MIPFPSASGAPAPDAESDIAAGIIRLTINGTDRILPTLKIGPFQDDFLPKQWPKVQSMFSEDRTDPAELLKLGTDTLLDLIVAYDASGALGGRDWLRNNADHNDLVRIAGAIVTRHTEGFRKAVLGISNGMAQINRQSVAMSVAQRLQERSTSSPSPDGDSTPNGSATA